VSDLAFFYDDDDADADDDLFSSGAALCIAFLLINLEEARRASVGVMLNVTIKE
jgi:hypothetical protein